MLFQDFFENAGFIMEGDAKMFDFPFCFEAVSCLIGMAAFIFDIDSFILCMHQVKIKIIYAAGL